MKYTIEFFVVLSLWFFGTMPQAFAQMDHRDFIQGPFENGKEVTETCLTCHPDESQAFMNSIHWTWESDPVTVLVQEEPVSLGKTTVLNNFCIGLKTNYPRCTSCHAGYGWEDESFDFSDAGNIDCLVCHDNTGTYSKIPTGAGAVDLSVDLTAVAKSVGHTTRESCGSCHFYGGGGNNVKHGDLEEALIDPPESLDVHMGGQDFTCTTCHITNDHQVSGNALSVSVLSDRIVTCENCHSETPHTKYAYFLDNHSKTVACQTCHIPEYARENPTKMAWDWSTAGVDSTAPTDEFGKPTYDKMKGSFVWAKNVVPSYHWYNGNSYHMIIGDPIDPDGINDITRPSGQIDDMQSKIYPFKIHIGKQIADAENNYLLPTHLFGGYWSHYDWDKAVSVGAEAYNMNYSGEYNFVDTEMYGKINHMVAPKEEALTCGDCHSQVDESRLDWKALGYPNGDPRYNGGSRISAE